MVFLLSLVLLFSMPIMVSPGYSFTTESKCLILEDAIQLAPEPMKTYLSEKKNTLQKAIKDENNIAVPGKKDRAYWEERMRGHFETIKERMKTDKDEYNTYIHFAGLVNAACNFMDTDNKDPKPPQKVTFDGYDQIEDLSKECQGLRSNDYQDTVNLILDQWLTAWYLSGYPIENKKSNSFVVHKSAEPRVYTTDGIDYAERYYQKVWNSMSPEERMEFYKQKEIEIEKRRLQMERERLRTEKERLREQRRPRTGIVTPGGTVVVW